MPSIQQHGSGDIIVRHDIFWEPKIYLERKICFGNPLGASAAMCTTTRMTRTAKTTQPTRRHTHAHTRMCAHVCLCSCMDTGAVHLGTRFPVLPIRRLVHTHTLMRMHALHRTHAHSLAHVAPHPSTHACSCASHTHTHECTHARMV